MRRDSRSVGICRPPALDTTWHMAAPRLWSTVVAAPQGSLYNRCSTPACCMQRNALASALRMQHNHGRRRYNKQSQRLGWTLTHTKKKPCNQQRSARHHCNTTCTLGGKIEGLQPHKPQPGVLARRRAHFSFNYRGARHMRDAGTSSQAKFTREMMVITLTAHLYLCTLPPCCMSMELWYAMIILPGCVTRGACRPPDRLRRCNS